MHNISEDEALRFPSAWNVCAHFARPISGLFTRKTRSPPCCISNKKTCALSTLVVSLMNAIPILSRNTLTLRGVVQTRHAGYDRCRVGVCAIGGFAFNSTRSYPRTRVSIPQEGTEFRADGTSRVIRLACLRLARVSVLRGDDPKEGFCSSTTTSIQVTSLSIISPSSRVSNVRSHFPLSAPLRRALSTARSRRSGSALVKVHVDTAEAC